LIYNKENDVKVIFDKEILEDEHLSFHPNVNTQTLDIP